jgi:hypothetical protein
LQYLFRLGECFATNGHEKPLPVEVRLVQQGL